MLSKLVSVTTQVAEVGLFALAAIALAAGSLAVR